MSEHRSRIPARSASRAGDTGRIGRFVMSADGPGRRGAESLASALLPYVTHLKIIQPPAVHNDLRTWKRAGASSDDVRRLIGSAPPRRLAVKVRQM